MIIDLSLFALIYVVAGITLIFVLWFYYEWRDKDFYQSEYRNMVFHCIKCDHLYVGKGGKEPAPCPQCEYENFRLRF